MKFEEIPGIWLILSGMVYVIGLVVSLFAASMPFVLGYGAGGGLVLLNAWASSAKVKRADFPNRGAVTASLLGGFYVRLVVLGICLFALIRFLQVNPLGLVAGLSVVPAGLLLMLGCIHIANRRPREV
jgi:hypothetical protein